MNGIQLEKVLGLIDANLAMNRDEVLRYIEKNGEEVVTRLLNDGKVEIPTSAGTLTIWKKDIAA